MNVLNDQLDRLKELHVKVYEAPTEQSHLTLPGFPQRREYYILGESISKVSAKLQGFHDLEIMVSELAKYVSKPAQIPKPES